MKIGMSTLSGMSSAPHKVLLEVEGDGPGLAIEL